MDNMNRKRIIALSVLTVVIIVSILLYGGLRKRRADQDAKSLADENGINVSYEISRDIKTKEDGVREIYNLSEWAEETSSKIDKVFGYIIRDERSSIDKDVSAYAPQEELDEAAKKAYWRSLHRSLEQEVYDTAEVILSALPEAFLFNASDFKGCFYHGWADMVIEVVDRLDHSEAKEAYSGAAESKIARDPWKAVPMDIGYALDPAMMLQGCEEQLDEYIKSDPHDYLGGEIERAESFSSRYGLIPSNLEEAKDKWERRSDRRRYSSSIDSSTTDNSYSSNRKRSYSGSSQSSTFDPDDHDIEGYYEDNRDEYDDYDDAYDGFMDDEGVWDDY